MEGQKKKKPKKQHYVFKYIKSFLYSYTLDSEEMWLSNFYAQFC